MEGDSGADAKETSNRGEGAQTNSSLSIAERMKKREIPAAVLVVSLCGEPKNGDF